ncbi:MAG: TolC family protein [Thermodesulfobacteriota bacterium]
MIPFRKKSTGRRALVRFGILLSVLGWFTALQAAALEDAADRALSLSDCIKIALETSPVSRAAEKAVLAAREAVGESRAPYYPELGFQARYAHWQQRAFLPSGLSLPGRPTPTLIGPTDDWMAGIKLRFTLFDSGERRALYQAALARKGAVEEEKSRVRQDLILGVFQGYYGMAAAAEILAVAEKNLARAGDHLRLAGERKEAGAVSKADVLRVEVEKANAELARVRAESLVRRAKGNLNTIMGLPAERALELDIIREETIPEDLPDLSAALGQALKNRPEIKAAEFRLESLKGGLSAVKSTFGPKIRAEGSYGRRDTEFFPDDSEWLAGVSLEWPLFTGYYRRHRLARAEAEFSKEEAEVRQLLLKVRQEVWTAHSQLHETRTAVQTTGTAVLQAEESMRLARERYEAGAGTVTDLLDAQTALARSQASRVEALWDYQVSRAVFKRSIGEIEKEIRP